MFRDGENTSHNKKTVWTISLYVCHGGNLDTKSCPTLVTP